MHKKCINVFNCDFIFLSKWFEQTALNMCINFLKKKKKAFYSQFIFTALGALPVSLQASDRDEEGTDNSRISMRIVSQDPTSPKFTLQTFTDMKNSMIAKLSLNGCFDYDVSLNMHTA